MEIVFEKVTKRLKVRSREMADRNFVIDRKFHEQIVSMKISMGNWKTNILESRFTTSRPNRYSTRVRSKSASNYFIFHDKARFFATLQSG